MRKDVKVINIMADGSICEDLSNYISTEHPLPEDTVRIIAELIRDGRRLRMEHVRKS